MERDGAPAELIEQLRRDDSAAEIWPDNQPAAEAFFAVSTQWRTCPRGDGGIYWQGLDYAGVIAGLRAAGIRVTKALWADLRIIEAAARDTLNGIEVAA